MTGGLEPSGQRSNSRNPNNPAQKTSADYRFSQLNPDSAKGGATR